MGLLAPFIFNRRFPLPDPYLPLWAMQEEHASKFHKERLVHRDGSISALGAINQALKVGGGFGDGRAAVLRAAHRMAKRWPLIERARDTGGPLSSAEAAEAQRKAKQSSNTRPFVFVSTFKWEMRKGWDVLLDAYLKVSGEGV